MDVFFEEVYTVIADSLLLALAGAGVTALVMATLLRLWMLMGGLTRRSPAWTRGARGFHAVFWIFMPAVLVASLGLLRGVETQTVEAVERHQPAIETYVHTQWRAHAHLLEQPGEALALQREQLDQTVRRMSGWGGWLLSKTLAQLDAWLLRAIERLDVSSPGWSEQPVASLVVQWRLAFFGLYFSLLVGLAPLLFLPLAEWLASVLSAKTPAKENAV